MSNESEELRLSEAVRNGLPEIVVLEPRFSSDEVWEAAHTMLAVEYGIGADGEIVAEVENHRFAEMIKIINYFDSVTDSQLNYWVDSGYDVDVAEAMQNLRENALDFQDKSGNSGVNHE